LFGFVCTTYYNFMAWCTTLRLCVWLRLGFVSYGLTVPLYHLTVWCTTLRLWVWLQLGFLSYALTVPLYHLTVWCTMILCIILPSSLRIVDPRRFLCLVTFFHACNLKFMVVIKYCVDLLLKATSLFYVSQMCFAFSNIA